MIIRALKNLFQRGASRPKRLGEGVFLVGYSPRCPSCGANIQLSPLAAASASCRCDCGEPLKIITATACTEQLRASLSGLETATIMARCSFKVFR